MWLCTQLDLLPVSLTDLENVEEMRIDITINVENSESLTIDFEIDKTILKRIAILELPLHIAVY